MKNSGARVSILGCGWLGLPLAEHLINLGYQVAGSTTTPEKLETLRQKQIQPYLINLVEESSTADLTSFLNSDYLIISFPPRLRAGHEKFYLPQIQRLYQAMQTSSVQYVLFVSSTSVYHDVNRVVTEEDLEALDTESPLYQAEKLLKQSTQHATTILRFGGLVGGNRHPGRFLAGKTGVAQPESPVNLIHLSDCIGLITQIIAQKTFNDTFNAAADQHPTRQQFYTAAARALQLEPPQFASSVNPAFKIICNAKIKSRLTFEFIYPDPMFFF
ncbi:SDR family oxidoreductase [Adhaeribacter swui]|uniref:SDR family oxidoreductase n=1 Tax=Adhaeribacter swui TaxID=2086471 RepID=A0A7G7GD58_9BACT|nr:SDR family oxidoreductase [Adhaeribacter swui]QNF35092.1 SDR family oxidoreductase [Adhaeribacter swui]